MRGVLNRIFEGDVLMNLEFRSSKTNHGRDIPRFELYRNFFFWKNWGLKEDSTEIT